jgi:hypothetical protein
LGREAVIPASVLVLLAFGTAEIKNSGAAPIVVRLAPSLTAEARFADKPQPIAAVSANVVTTSGSVAEAAVLSVAVPLTQVAVPLTENVPPPHEAEPIAQPIVTAALTDPAEMLQPEAPSEQAVTMGPAVTVSPANSAAGDTKQIIGSTEVLDECFVVEACVDRYLWALYQRTPKEDSVKQQDQRTVMVKRKGKMVAVTRTVTNLADEDFSWKDPKAADKAGMSMMDYVFGGMDRDFKLKLFHMLYAAEQAGLSPGITSGFRDDYRQSIASGLKAANDRSYHGGSFRGGYGHGLAADVVSTNGATRTQRLASTEVFWGWIDAHGKEFGVGRPYLDHDPPHVAPIDGKEYADHNPKMRARHARSAPKANSGVAVRDDHSVAKRVRTARS